LKELGDIFKFRPEVDLRAREIIANALKKLGRKTKSNKKKKKNVREK